MKCILSKSTREKYIKELFKDLIIEIPKDCDKESWIKGYQHGIQEERRRFHKMVKEFDRRIL